MSVSWKPKVVHLLFEQSGTFKNAFKELGIPAYDYDYENRFGEVDYQLDLFKEIENAYENKNSIFDNINKDDLIVSFFPCTYFSVQNELIWSRKAYNFKTWDEEKIDNYILEREREREKYFQILLKYIEVIKRRGIKMIFENPYSKNYILTRREIKKPSLIIQDRTIYGDYYVKPTAFWFYNIEPTLFSQYIIKNDNKLDKPINLQRKGIQRSLMHSDFAKNFINKYVLGL